jgi:predicted metal-dependent HD superfamily phosphohydrolase
MDPQAARAFILAELRHGLPAERSYHSLEHTLDVYASAITIAEEEGFTGESLDLIKTAALFHDSGFLVDPGNHEMASCGLARKHLPRFGYGKDQVECVCELIMATKIPQSPRDKMAEVLCDADLDYLGRPDFHTIGDKLYQEMRTFNGLQTRHDWNRLQEGFLAKHRYFTETSRKVRGPLKREHLAWVRKWLEENP